MLRVFLFSLTCAALAACSGGTPAELTATLQPVPPASGQGVGGSIDRVEYDAAADRVTVTGWHMLTPKTKLQDLKVYAGNAASVESISRFERPDVVTAMGKNEMLNSGFTLVLKTEPGLPLSELCISINDQEYGARVLAPATLEQVRCTSLGQ